MVRDRAIPMAKTRIVNRLTTTRVKFAFEKYVHLILDALPPSDLVRIREIAIVEKFTDRKCSENAVGCYRFGKNTRDATIEIHLPRFLERKIHSFTFRFFPEIAAYKLSPTVCHEVGHHAHRAWRHGIRKPKEEAFAEAYAKAGAFSYLRSRSAEILSSYERASYCVWLYGLRGWPYWRRLHREMADWLARNKDGIPFP